jgi:adenylate cyclase
MNRPRPIRLRFGPFEADLLKRELQENGEAVHIQSKPFQFLASLLHHHGEVISREAMSHSLWPDIYVQVNQGLNAAARKVRMILKDDAFHPRYFETVGSRGYRFIHPTEVTCWSSEVTEVRDAPIRIAVLPLKYDTPDNVAIAGGLTAEITARLSRIHPRLVVFAAAELYDHALGNGNLESLRQNLGIQHVLTGTFSMQTGHLKLSFALISAGDGQRVWGETYEGPVQDLLRIQDDFVLGILPYFRSLPAGIVPARSFETNFNVYNEYLRGRFHQRKGTMSDLRQAVTSFRTATEADTQFMPAHSALAETYNVIGFRGLIHPRAAYDRAIQSAKKALELDPTSADSMVALGWSTLALERDWAAATRSFERALRLNPNAATGYCSYGYLLLSRGRADDGVAAVENARRIDPHSLGVNNDLSAVYYFARQFDDAVKQARRTLELNPASAEACSYLGLSFLAQRRTAEGIEQLQAAVEYSKADPVMLAQLAYAQAEAGRFPVAEAILRQIESQDTQAPQPAYHIALARLALGNVNEAFRWLEYAYQQCSHWMLLMQLDPRVDILRGTRRFDQLCRMMRPAEAKKVANSN